MVTANDVENAIRNDEYYRNLIIPMCFPAYFLAGEDGVRRQYMSPGSEDMSAEVFNNVVEQCRQVMVVYQLILQRS